MLSTYCQDCGTKNEYQFEKPNFCHSCGTPLYGAAAKQVKVAQPKQAVSRARKEVELDEEGSDVYEVPSIESFEYDIEVSSGGTFNMGSLFGNQPIEEVKKPTKKRGRARKK